MSKMLVVTIMMMFAPISAFSQANDAPASSDMDRAVPEGCKDFTSEQMKDPNSPCYAEVSKDLDPRRTEGEYFDANLTNTPLKDECNGCHVMTGIDLPGNTNENVYNVKFLKNAVPQYGSPVEADGGDEKSGTD